MRPGESHAFRSLPAVLNCGKSGGADDGGEILFRGDFCAFRDLCEIRGPGTDPVEGYVAVHILFEIFCRVQNKLSVGEFWLKQNRILRIAAAETEKPLILFIENDNVWIDDEYEYVFYGQKVASDLLSAQPKEAFTQTVSFVQEYVEKEFELRVTVVGRKVFACKIDSQCMDEDKGKVDWRQGYDFGLKHEPFDLPASVEDFCRNYLHEMCLNFGCFDFIVTPQGEYVFLECNPNGQWLWIELLTGQKISVAIAECLIRASI